MFFLVALLLGLTGLQAGQNPTKVVLQTTVPEKISSPETETDPEHHVAYNIIIAGKPYFIHLKRQSFLTQVSTVYSYHQDGTKNAQNLSVQMNCSYNGFVTGFPNSLVTLSICSGLRGTIQFQNISYGIEPMEAVSGFVHIVYENNNDNANTPILDGRETYAWFNDSQYPRRSSKSEFTKLFPRYLEMDIVVDKNLFDYMGSNTNAVTQKVIEIIGLVNTMLVQLKLTVVISSIDIWSDKNKISTEGHPDDVLSRFLNWKHNNSQHNSHHVAYLLVFEKHPAAIGATFPGTMCDSDYDAGVALYPEGLSIESYTVIIVQLLGLSLGLTYDNTDTCFCSGDVCTMTPKAVYSGGIKHFSTCSLDNFKYFASKNGLGCLQNNPFGETYTLSQESVCGNGKLEGNEQCDCGTEKECTHKSCCDSLVCRLKRHAMCGSGECCTINCKLKPPNTLCRKSADECDFVEYCNGKDSHCPPDTYARNGHSCDSGGAICYSGRCRTFDRQCQKLVGGDSRGAPFRCFEEFNSRLDRFGNCVDTYCLFDRVLCGKLICTWPHKKLVSRVNLSVVYAHVRDDTCISTYKHSDRSLPNQHTTYNRMSDRDETFVEDGTMCGPEMYCERAQCKEVRFLINSTSCDENAHCNDHGICNNFQHCHCEKNYAPPDCEKKEGAFGSEDDGHTLTEGKNFWLERQATLSKGFLLIFYSTVPVVIIIIVVALIKQKKLTEPYYRGEPGSERSMSKESSMDTKSSSSRSNSL